MPEQDAAGAALERALAQLRLGELPEPLLRALTEALGWLGRLEREAAEPARRG